jgi:transcriptional regulator with XRE-family HTH domain
MSQREFASHLGVPQTTVNRWETGKTTPTAEYLGLMHDLARRHTRPFEPFASATKPSERIEIALVASQEWLKKTKGPRGKDSELWVETFHQMLSIVSASRLELRQARTRLEEMQEPTQTQLEGLLGEVQRILGVQV